LIQIKARGAGLGDPRQMVASPETVAHDRVFELPRPRAWPRARETLIAAVRAHGAIAGLLVVSLGLRIFKLAAVAGQLIGDEVWYVQDARVILGLPVLLKNLPAAPLSGLDPNSEHPPLAKLIIAGFMRVFGNREIAWRIPSIVLGLLCIWLVYAIVLELGGAKRQAFFAAFILAFENLSFIHGRIAMLDIYLVAFVLLGAWLYLSKRFELAGVAFALAALCKMNGLLGLASVVLYELFLMRRDRWPRPSWPTLRPLVLTCGFCAAFFLLGLGALDCYWTEFRSPFAHIAHMFSYHTGLKHVGPPEGNASTPFQWWLDSGAFNYLTWTINDSTGRHFTLFRAAMNEYVIAAAPIALFYAAQRVWKARSRLGAFALAMFVGNFGPMFLAWVVFSRTSYIFYMVPAVPAFACAIALLGGRLPRPVQSCFAFAVLYAFFFNFPFRYF
jgi:dolichyl-phosphate-mannose-protein mannosyltransferase